MTLNTDSYRQQTAFRINQALSDELSPLAQRHVAEIAIANVRALCDEVDALRADAIRIKRLAAYAACGKIDRGEALSTIEALAAGEALGAGEDVREYADAVLADAVREEASDAS